MEKQPRLKPKRVVVSGFDTGDSCPDIESKPANVDAASWPASCADVKGSAVEQAIANGDVGFMHLLGRRLGNTPLIEMIPDQTIQDTQLAQATSLTYPGCYPLAPGTRAGSGGGTNYRTCQSGHQGTTPQDCYIGRWGWIGDRASLEDQIANAATVEMNVTSKEGYGEVHPNATDEKQLVRYRDTLCGPADAACQKSLANSDITEQEIRDMATYQRWIGIPQRSEYQVSSQVVQDGEAVFKGLHCDSCHVIRKIPFVEQDNMLPDEERNALRKLEISTQGKPEYPFVSYLGTDLLMHDMGYLSQVAPSPGSASIRNPDGTVKAELKAYVQNIRTPALKGLRFNPFVTDSNHNTTNPIPKLNPDRTPAGPEVQASIIPGCDFLLHDGRACDAMEAAWLHDGPAVKALGMIAALNALTPEQLTALRAFLYSL
jgi:hypothetical protein